MAENLTQGKYGKKVTVSVSVNPEILVPVLASVIRIVKLANT